MKLTDTDEKIIESVLRRFEFSGLITPTDFAIYVAGKRVGREDMRERALRAIDEIVKEHADKIDVTADQCFFAVQALPLDG